MSPTKLPALNKRCVNANTHTHTISVEKIPNFTKNQFEVYPATASKSRKPQNYNTATNAAYPIATVTQSLNLVRTQQSSAYSNPTEPNPTQFPTTQLRQCGRPSQITHGNPDWLTAQITPPLNPLHSPKKQPPEPPRTRSAWRKSWRRRRAAAAAQKEEHPITSA